MRPVPSRLEDIGAALGLATGTTEGTRGKLLVLVVEQLALDANGVLLFK